MPVRHIRSVLFREYSYAGGRVAAGMVFLTAAAMQGLDMGTTPGRSEAQSGGCSGMVRRLVRMFKGEHYAEALQAPPSSQGLQCRCARQPAKSRHGLGALTNADRACIFNHTHLTRSLPSRAEDVCMLPGEAPAWRRRGALEALGPLIRLLGGRAFSRTGIHQPLLNEASLPVSLSGPAYTGCRLFPHVSPVFPQTLFCWNRGVPAKRVNVPVSSQGGTEAFAMATEAQCVVFSAIPGSI